MEYGKITGMGTTGQFQRAQTDRKAAAEINAKNAVSAQAGKSPASPSSKSDTDTAAPEGNA